MVIMPTKSIYYELKMIGCFRFKKKNIKAKLIEVNR